MICVELNFEKYYRREDRVRKKKKKGVPGQSGSVPAGRVLSGLDDGHFVVAHFVRQSLPEVLGGRDVSADVLEQPVERERGTTLVLLLVLQTVVLVVLLPVVLVVVVVVLRAAAVVVVLVLSLLLGPVPVLGNVLFLLRPGHRRRFVIVRVLVVLVVPVVPVVVRRVLLLAVVHHPALLVIVVVLAVVNVTATPTPTGRSQRRFAAIGKHLKTNTVPVLHHYPAFIINVIRAWRPQSAGFRDERTLFFGYIPSATLSESSLGSSLCLRISSR